MCCIEFGSQSIDHLKEMKISQFAFELILIIPFFLPNQNSKTLRTITQIHNLIMSQSTSVSVPTITSKDTLLLQIHGFLWHNPRSDIDAIGKYLHSLNPSCPVKHQPIHQRLYKNPQYFACVSATTSSTGKPLWYVKTPTDSASSESKELKENHKLTYVFVVNLYMVPAEWLEMIRSQVKDKKNVTLLIFADMNNHSDLWHEHRLNPRPNEVVWFNCVRTMPQLATMYMHYQILAWNTYEHSGFVNFILLAQPESSSEIEMSNMACLLAMQPNNFRIVITRLTELQEITSGITQNKSDVHMEELMMNMMKRWMDEMNIVTRKNIS